MSVVANSHAKLRPNMSVARVYGTATRAALVYMARGTCYYPGCDARLIAFVDGEPYITYQIAHIRDAQAGNRYDATMTDDQRRGFANLILLCTPHHQLVDQRHPERYPTAELEQWKRERESVAPDTGFGQLAQMTAEVVEAALLEAAITLSLGGEGGAAPGAGGGGGAGLYGGTGGPGGPGGHTYFFDKSEPAAMGAGAGGPGGDAVGPDAFGGEGGGGGDYVRKTVDVTPGEELVIQVGGGGRPTEDGGDSFVARVSSSGPVDLVRAKGGRAGRSGAALRDKSQGPSVRITSAFLADAAQVRDGLLFVVGGAWTNYLVDSLPNVLNGVVVLIAEPTRPGPRTSELLVSLFDSDGEAVGSAKLIVGYDDVHESIRIPALCQFGGVNLARGGVWRVTVQSGDVELANIPFEVSMRSEA